MEKGLWCGRMNRVRQQTGCDRVPFRGRGIHAVFLDTGVCLHPDLADRIEGVHDFVKGRAKPYDDNGHGTHVVGCLAGNGYASDGKYRGIAPECLIWSGKILDRNGNGNLSELVEAMEWIVALHDRYVMHVVNISVGAGQLQDCAEFQYLSELIHYLSEKKVLVFCAAGNFISNVHSISILGSLEWVITVGCHEGNFWQDRSDLCQNYSCTGNPQAVGRFRKPDLVAPGTDIVSCNVRFYRSGSRVWNAYCKKSGTSMATPIAAGAAALFKEKYPGSTLEDFKAALAKSSVDLGLPFYRQGAGMLYIPKLLEGA